MRRTYPLIALSLASLSVACGAGPLSPSSVAPETVAPVTVDAAPIAQPVAPVVPAPAVDVPVAPAPIAQPVAPAPVVDAPAPVVEAPAPVAPVTVLDATMTIEHWYGGKLAPFGRRFEIVIDGDRVTFGPYTMTVAPIGFDLIARDHERTLMLYVSLDRWTYNGSDGVAGGTLSTR